MTPCPDWLTGFDLRALAPEFYRDPYPYYAALREHDPARRMPDGSVLLTRYADCLQVYKDPVTFSSDKKAEFFPKYGASPLFEHHTTSLVFNDPPLHTRVRKLIIGALSQRAVDSMQVGLIALVDRLLDDMAARQHVDLIEHFAAAIPIEIIGNLLGVPHDEREPLRDWSLAILGALEPALNAEQLARGNRAVSEFTEYLRGLVADRRARPGDPATDVLTRLIVGEPNGERLSESELLQNCIFILNAGHETTTNLIGNALHALTLWPDQRSLLTNEPALIKTAIEEFLRFESSNQLGNRMSTADSVIGGVALPANTRITLCIGAANRDPAQFVDPDRLDITRQHNRHLAFGSGTHQCAGLAVARLEGIIAVGRFLKRFPNYAIDHDRAQRGGRARFRGFLALPATQL
ncbi:MAG: cytochrome P450 [Burkholderiales bacterium]|nr:MAG: cytochrome P450 [Betaproteobacteria bacterium]TAG24682.1 MAG: cytochrome P450 [Burkholderiales bacterium]